MKQPSLSRQITRSMMGTAIGITLLVVLTSYAFYYTVITHWPELIDENSWTPDSMDLLWLIITTLAALALASWAASRLTRRLLVPLTSVADSIRRVAHGDLAARGGAGGPRRGAQGGRAARAVTGDRALGEVWSLADNFNALAGQLQRVTEEQKFWNAAIAHELRTPVTILRGRLQGLAEGIFTPDETQFRSLLSQVEGLSALIEDLRVVSLAESGHLDLQWRDADLARAIEAETMFFQEVLEAAGLQPQLALTEGAVRCDPVRIRQALRALLENARRHASPGILHIRLQQRHDGWELSVQDQGPGIPEGFAVEMFQAFRRAPASTSNPGGSGLGLAVVAAIALAHGGQAGHEAAGKGSRFILRWPAA